MKLTYQFIFVFLAITSCRNTEKNNTIENTDVIKQSHYFDYSNTEFKSVYSDTLLNNFSNNDYKDSFILHLSSGNINESKAVFSIKNHKNTTIYTKEFYVSDLINGYDLISIKTNEQMKDYIINKAKSLLSSDNFSFLNNPEEVGEILIQSNEEDFGDYDTYLECKKSNRPIFSYSLNEENISFIAYSIKNKKTIEILSCC